MKTETNKSQLDDLVLILAEMINMNPPQDIAEDVVYDHVVEAFNKLRLRSEQITPRSGYKVSLTDQQARCVYLFVQTNFIPEDRYEYGAIQLQALINQIHSKYAIRIRAIRPTATKIIGAAGGIS